MDANATAVALADHASAINRGWVMAMAFNVLMMQSGFAMLEVGTSSAASAAAIAMKNISDMSVSCAGFFLTGWALAFGVNSSGGANALTGEGEFLLIGTKNLYLFIFQYAFAATAVTIVSGAVVGRIRFKHYVMLAFVVSGAIYPVVAHSGWDTSGFLHLMGFADFAGSGVVHLTGGSVGLAASLWLGPRPGVFRDNGDYVPQRSSPTQALFGTICLWVAWFSFNAGSSQALTDGGADVSARAAVSTLLASGSGFLVALVWSWSRSRGQHIDVFDAATGLLAGLVGVTAACASIQPWEAFLIGAIASLAALASGPLLERLRVDDAVAVIPVHFVGGLVGTILVGVFANDPAAVPGAPNREAGLFHGGSGRLLGVQALACLFIVAWSSAGFLVVALATRQCFGGLRVPNASQDKLDQLEHGIQSQGTAMPAREPTGSGRAAGQGRGDQHQGKATPLAQLEAGAVAKAGSAVRERAGRAGKGDAAGDP